MQALIIVGMVLLVVMLIGHGLWELVAWAFRGFQPRQKMMAPPMQRSAYPLMVDERMAARRVLGQLVSKGLLEPEVRRQVEQAITELEAAPAVRPVTIPMARVQQPIPASEPIGDQDRAPAPPIPQVTGVRPVSQRRPPVIPPVAAYAHAPVRPRAQRIPRRPMSEMLKAFMEESNIRWGELVGGILIVGCSIALVISLWAGISQRPMLKVGVFTGVVAGLFGLGLYADRKWKLPATSWGILLTAMLMVPLHLAAMVVIGGQEQSEPVALGVELLAAVVLGVLTWLAAGVIARGWRALVAGGVMALSIVGPALYVSGVLQAGGSLRQAMVVLAGMVGMFVVIGLGAAWQIGRRKDWQGIHVREAICAVLLPLFAAVPSLIMHAHFNSGLPDYWRVAGVILALMAAPLLLASGQILARAGESVRPWRVEISIGQLLVICGLLMCIGLAWGMPVTLVAASLVVAAILGGAGYLHRDPLQLVGALLAMLVAYCGAMPVLMGRIGWSELGHAFWTARIGMEMLPAVALVAGAAWVICRRETIAGTLGYALAGGIAALSLIQVLAAVYLSDTVITGAWMLFAGYAIAGIGAAAVLRSRGAAVAGTALAICALQQLDLLHLSPWLVATLAVGLAWALCTSVSRWIPKPLEFVAKVLAVDGAWWTGAAAVVLLVTQIPDISLPAASVYAWIITALFALLLVGRWAAPEFAALEVALSGAVCLQLLSVMVGMPVVRQVLDCCIAILAIQGAWTALRLALKRLGRIVEFLSHAVSVDRVLGAAAMLITVGTAGACLCDAGSSELFPRTGGFGPATQLMLGSSYQGLWMAMATIVIISLLEVATGIEAWLFVTASTIYALSWVIASRVWPEMAASSVRLASLVVLLALSIPIWMRQRFVQSANLRGLAIALGAIPLVGLTLMASAANLQGVGPHAPTVGSIFAAAGSFGSYVVPMLLLTAIFAGHAARERSQALAMLSAGTLNLTVTLAYLLQVGLNTPVEVLQLVQINAIAAGGFAWVWWMLFRYVANCEEPAPTGLRTLAGLCVAVTTLLAGLGQLLIWGARHVPPDLTEVGTVTMLWVLAGLSAALCWLIWPRWTRLHGAPAGIALVSTALAATFSTPANWTALHIALAGHVLAMWATGLIRCRAAEADDLQSVVEVDDGQLNYARPDTGWIGGVLQATAAWGIALAIAVALFSCRSMLGDPQSPWWSIGALVSIASLWIVLAQRELAPAYLYPAAGAISLAVTFLWGSRFWQFTSHGVRDLVMLNVLTLAGCGLASVVLELQVFAKAARRVIRRLPPLHVTAGWACVLVLLVTSFIQVAGMPSLVTSINSMLIALAAAATVIALLIACLWDSTMRSAARLLYLAGFAVVALVMDISGLRTRELLQVSLISGIGLSIIWAILLHRWDEIRQYAARFGATLYPETELMRANAWFGLALLVAILGHEAILTATTGRAEMSLWLIIALCMLLLILAGGLIAIALGKVIDVLCLPFADRETYVYVAEAVIGVLCIHVRLTCPELFTGFLLQYWPIIAMVIAFGMAGLAEALRRKGVGVIAGPVGQTAFLVPLAPALFAGMMHTQVDYGVTLLLVGSYYIGLAIVRKSVPAGILGAIALNGAFWSVLWDYQSLRIDLHPQLWLIPPCLCVMLGTWLGRGRMDAKQVAALRYSALIIAYASSTADIALVGVANAPWLAGVLGLLSVIGVMAGILLRIRSFLYMGTAFLGVAILTLIYHATANLHQTWLLWLCGIGLGVAILMAFAMFERNRQKMLETIDQLKQWKA